MLSGESIFRGMAATVTLHLLQGQTFRRTFLFTRPDALSTEEDPLPNVPLELIGCEARMQLRNRYGGDVLMGLTSETDGGIEIEPLVDGAITIEMTAEQTDVIGTIANRPLRPRTAFQYDLELVYPGGDVLRLMESATNTISPNITRDET